MCTQDTKIPGERSKKSKWVTKGEASQKMKKSKWNFWGNSETVEMSKFSEWENWQIVVVTTAHDSRGGPQIATLSRPQGNFGGSQKLEADLWNTWEDQIWEGNMVSRRKGDIWCLRGVRWVWASVRLTQVRILTLPLKNCMTLGNSLIYSNLSLPIWKVDKKRPTLQGCFKDDMLACSTDKKLVDISLNKI